MKVCSGMAIAGQEYCTLMMWHSYLRTVLLVSALNVTEGKSRDVVW